jgi:hypothetical protein
MEEKEGQILDKATAHGGKKAGFIALAIGLALLFAGIYFSR